MAINYLSIDHMIVYASLLITLIVGLRAGKGIKTIREYAVGNKMFGTTALVLTYMATNLSGSLVLSNTGLIFSNGIIIGCAFLGFLITEVNTAIFIAPKAVFFKDCLTMGDLMEKFYGKYAGIIAGGLGLLQAILLSGLELVALGIVCQSLLGIPSKFGIIVGGIILALYSSHGGIKAVVTTDIIQFMMLLIGVPLIAFSAIHFAGGISAIFHNIPSDRLSICSHKDFFQYLVCFLSWGIFPSGLIDSALIQRMLMSNNPNQLRKQYLIAAASNPIFQTITVLIGLAGLVLYPNIESQNVVPTIIEKLLPSGIKGCTIVGLVALIMSTVDSYLHVAGLTLVHDLIRPVYGKSLTSHQEKRLAQWSTIVLGLMAINIGLSTTNMFGLFLDSLSATGPILMFPLLTGIIGLKPEKKAFYIAMVTTIITWISCNWFLPENYSYLTILISILANGIAFFGTHYWINKGFKMDNRKPEKPLSSYKPTNSVLKSIFPSHLLAYVKKQCQSQELPYILAGLCCLAHLIIPHLLCDKIINSYTSNFNWLFLVYSLGSALCILLMLKDKYSARFQCRYLPFFFYFTLFYCLPFISILMFIVSHGDSCWLANLLVALTLLVVLVDWGMIILLSLVSIGCNFLLYPFFEPINWETHAYYTFFMVCQILLALFVAILFSHRKQKQYQQLAHTCQQLMRTHSLWETDYLYNLQYQALQKKQMELQKEPFATAKAGLRYLARLMPLERSLSQRGLEQLDAFVNYYTTSFYHSMDAMQLKLSTCSLKELLGKINIALHDSALTNRIVIQLPTKQQTITCDVEKIVQLLTNHLKALEKQILPEWKIQLTIHDTELCYRLQVVTQKECLRKLPALAFVLCPNEAQGEENRPWALQSSYMGTTTPVPLAVPKTAVDLPERNQAQVIEAHYGYYEEKKPQGGGGHEEKKPQGGGDYEEKKPQGGGDYEEKKTQGGQDIHYRLVVLPVSVDAIRSAIVDKAPLPKEFPLDTPESLKIEQNFLDQLDKSFCVLDETIARDAIHMIKYAHQGQRRKSGEPFYTHPLQVAMILLTITKDSDAILAALLHDVIEDTAISLDQIAYQYGRRVAYLVQTLTHLDPTGKKTKLTEAENHAQLAAAENKEAVLIKLADRLHNMRTIAFHKPEKQRDIAQETLEFYVPLGKTIKEPAVQTLVEELKTICEALVKGWKKV